jgi:hypothetical protein
MRTLLFLLCFFVAASSLAIEVSCSDRPVSFELRDVPLRSVLEVLAQLTGCNFATDFSDSVSISVRNTSWREVIIGIARAQELLIDERDNILVLRHRTAVSSDVPQFGDKTVSFDLRGAKLTSVVDVLARISTRSVTVADEVASLPITFEADRIPLTRAWKVLLLTHGLRMDEFGDGFVVSKAEVPASAGK